MKRLELTAFTELHLQGVLNAACWAPSPDNNQRWSVEVVTCRPSEVHLELSVRVDATEPPELFEHRWRPSIVALGCFAHNVAWVLEAYGFVGVPAGAAPRPGSPYRQALRFVRGGPGDLNEVGRRCGVIRARRSNRALYSPVALDPSETASLAAPVADAPGVWVQAVRPSIRLAWALGRLDRVRFLNARIVSELVAALRFGAPAVRQSGTGLDLRALGLSAPESLVLRVVARWPALQGLFRAGLDRVAAFLSGTLRARFAGALFCLAADRDESPAWFDLGRQLQALWLRCAERGLSLQLSASPVLLAMLRRGETADFDARQVALLERSTGELVRELALDPGLPLLIARVGRPLSAPALERVRRPVPVVWQRARIRDAESTARAGEAPTERCAITRPCVRSSSASRFPATPSAAPSGS